MSARAIGGITVPDTPLVRDVTALIRDAEDDLLFDHSRRVFLFGATQTRQTGLSCSRPDYVHVPPPVPRKDPTS
jgi:hypothetical protein